VQVEPTDRSFQDAARFAIEGRFDGFVSVGGGSAIDTCKAANLYSTYPADFLAYVNAPIGAGRAVPGAVKPHIACPTTCGTGSEVTGVAVFDLAALHVKTGISSKLLKPTLALVDPTVARSLPANVVAGLRLCMGAGASGGDEQRGEEGEHRGSGSLGLSRVAGGGGAGDAGRGPVLGPLGRVERGRGRGGGEQRRIRLVAGEA